MTETTGFEPALSFAEACDRGKVREENQDRVRHATTAVGELAIVADGIGGYRGGATAAQMVVDTVVASIAAREADYSPARAIAEAAAAANCAVFDAAASGDLAFRNMGSTVVLALITRDTEAARAWIGHIGDSRAYLARGERLTRLTRDHSAVQELLDQHEITLEQAKKSPQASVLTRSLGHMPEVEIEISMVDLELGDVLLLCSDGLWGFVAEQAIEQVVVASGMEIDQAATGLVNLALEAGGPDNIGVEMVACNAPSVPPETKTDEAKPAAHAASDLRTALIWSLVVLIALGALAWIAEQEHWLSPLLSR
ncbi:MAG: protein phosphatase 2C domain-containing protein [Terracidiphilus sp.]